jgi:DNA polymerase/3'-5' exonuclease PolX
MEYVASQLLAELRPYCERISMAGSFRRQKPLVGDLEIVAIPMQQLDLFGDPGDITEVDLWLGNAISKRTVRVLANGPKQKKFTWVQHQAQVDMYLQPDPRTWGVNMVLRTGPDKFCRWLVTSRDKGGARPPGLVMRKALVYSGVDVVVDTDSEEKFFSAWGLPWIEPNCRETYPPASNWR